jgi:hypothetical protein
VFTEDSWREYGGLGEAHYAALDVQFRVFWVTGSVAVGTPRDGRDTMGRNSIIEAYLARRADFAKEFANSTNRSIRFSRPRMTLV